MSTVVALFLSLVKKFEYKALLAFLVALAAVVGPAVQNWVAGKPTLVETLGALAAIASAFLPSLLKKPEVEL